MSNVFIETSGILCLNVGPASQPLGGYTFRTPANTRNLPNLVLALAQRCRRWVANETALRGWCQFAGTHREGVERLGLR